MKSVYALLAIVALVGCSREPAGPSYTEATATYDAEVSLLNDLERQAKEALAERDASIEKARETERKNVEENRAMYDALFTTDATERAEHTARYRDIERRIEESRSRSVRAANRLYDAKMEDLAPKLELQRRRVQDASKLREAAAEGR